MDIFHTIDFKPRDHVEPDLDALGIKYRKLPFGDSYIIRVRLSESASQWAAFQELYRAKGKDDRAYETYFTDEEILSAEWLRLYNNSPEMGYPQPERRWQAEHFNYTDRCPRCGSFRQVSAFFIKAEPKPGKYDFMSLHWTSALFAVPRVFAALEANHIQGYEQWPIFLYQTKEPATTVAQVYIPTVAAPGLVGAEDLDPVTCAACGVLKYNKYHKRGIMYLRRESIPTGVDLFETYEWFGEGYQPRREIIASSRYVKLAYAERWRGLAFKVVEAV
jgi:hypothetical protein